MNAAGGSDTTAAQDHPTPSASLTPGELLRRERERRSIPLLQAAEDMHLDVRILQAMEANRFELLGVPVYARGHLRKYAELLGLSPQFILERYEALNDRDRPAVPTAVPISATAAASIPLERASNKGPVWMSIGVIAIAFGWWIFDGLQSRDSKQSAEQVPAMEAPVDSEAASEPAPTVEPPAPTPAPTGVPTAPPPTTAESSANVTSPPQAAVVQNSPPAAATTPAPANTPAVVPAAEDVRVRLEYSGACWTEIHDAAGKRLAFGMGDIGRVRVISGTPPLRVILGNVSAVTVQINDSAVVVPRQSGKDSAKFVIAAGGAVQTL